MAWSPYPLVTSSASAAGDDIGRAARGPSPPAARDPPGAVPPRKASSFSATCVGRRPPGAVGPVRAAGGGVGPGLGPVGGIALAVVLARCRGCGRAVGACRRPHLLGGRRGPTRGTLRQGLRPGEDFLGLAQVLANQLQALAQLPLRDAVLLGTPDRIDGAARRGPIARATIRPGAIGGGAR